MIAFIKSENYTTKEERIFDKWMLKVEKQLGFKLEEDGLAWALFKDGCSVEEAVQEIE